MALIICPECGKKVSDLAKTCPDCGYPIASMNPAGTVTIKLCNGLAGKVQIFDMNTLQVFWTWKAGQVATFDVSEETEIGIVWGIGKPNAKCDTTAKVKGNERYNLVWQRGFISSTIVLNKVDVVDSQ